MRKLKPKDREFAMRYAMNNRNGTQAVKDVFGVQNESYARVKASRMITNDNIADEIDRVEQTLKSALLKKGITPERIAEKIDVLLDACDEHGQADFTAVDKGLKHATAIYGVTAEQEKRPDSITYNFIFSPEVQEKVRLINEEIKAGLIAPRAS